MSASAASWSSRLAFRNDTYVPPTVLEAFWTFVALYHRIAEVSVPAPEQSTMMYQRILVPLDGSALSETALRAALPIASRQSASIEIVHVHELRDIVGLAPVFDARLDAEVAKSMRSALRSLAERSSAESGVPVEAVFLEGDILSRLIEYADRSNPDLVVMNTHGRSGLSRFWLGSVTDAIVRKLCIPILVTRTAASDDQSQLEDSTASTSTSASKSEDTEGGRRDVHRALNAQSAPMFPRVLVPLDGSSSAEAVFPSISALVMPDEATLALFSVVSVPVVTGPGLDIGVSTPSPYLADIANAEADALNYLEDVAESLRAIGIQATTHVVVHSNPATAILNFAADSFFASGNLVDLIALAPHERTMGDRLLLGSVTDKVLRGATAPVLLHHDAFDAASSQPQQPSLETPHRHPAARV